MTVVTFCCRIPLCYLHFLLPCRVHVVPLKTTPATSLAYNPRPPLSSPIQSTPPPSLLISIIIFYATYFMLFFCFIYLSLLFYQLLRYFRIFLVFNKCFCLPSFIILPCCQSSNHALYSSAHSIAPPIVIVTAFHTDICPYISPGLDVRGHFVY